MTRKSMSRRNFLKMSGVAGGGLIASQFLGGNLMRALAQDGALSVPPEAMNPLGLEAGTSVEGVFFQGGYGIDYINFAADLFRQLHPDNEISVEGIQQVGDVLRPRFIEGNPPDVIDNSGAGSLDTLALLQEGLLADLTPLLEAPALDTPDATVADTFFPLSQNAGIYEGAQRYLMAAYTIHGIWYSETLFQENGWEYPTTWNGMLDLCENLKTAGYETPWAYGGRNAGHYVVRGIIYPLIYKMGGMEAINDIMTAADGAWEREEVLQAVQMVYALAENGYVLEGAEALTHTESQTEWLRGNAVFYPVGSWIENEMRDVTPENFNMVMKPIPGTTEDQFNSVLAGASETFFVPAQASNVVGGMEYLRCLFSKASANFFAQNVGSIMPVLGGAERETLSSAVRSALDAVDGAGEDVFPLNLPYAEVWDGWKANVPELMTRRINPEQFVERMESISDDVRNNL